MSARMVSLFCLFLSISVILSVQAHANVDISRKVYLPELEGFRVVGDIPTEINRSNEHGPVEALISENGIEALLSAAGLPPMFEQITVSEKVPQCQVTQTLETQSYRLFTNDREWLRTQGRWCRFKRKVFGGCKPKTLQDVISIAKVQATSPLTSVETSASSIASLKEADCVSEYSADGLKLEALRQCAAFQIAGGKISDCMPSDQFATLEMGAPLLKDGDGWSFPLQASATLISRAPLAPRIELSTMGHKLQSLQLGGLILRPKSDGPDWSDLFDVASATWKLSPDWDTLTVSAVYVTTRKNQDAKYDQKEGKISLSYGTKTVANLPSSVTLTRGEILDFEVVSDSTRHLGLISKISERCSSVPDVQKSKFGKFMCEHLQSLGTQTQIRIKFADSRGIERSLTWEGAAPIASCWQSDESIILCDVGDDWNAWIRDPSLELRRVFADPVYDDSTQITFDQIQGFVPKAAGMPPLTTFVTPQSKHYSIR